MSALRALAEHIRAHETSNILHKLRDHQKTVGFSSGRFALFVQPRVHHDWQMLLLHSRAAGSVLAGSDSESWILNADTAAIVNSGNLTYCFARQLRTLLRR
jgi:hypothetical protein